MAEALRLLAPDATALYKKAAQLFVEAVAEAVRVRGMATVALSGGSTPKKLFELLAESYYAERINWSKLHIFWVDERCVPPQHVESNYKLVHDTLFSKILIPSANIHRIAGEMSSPQEAAKAYDSELKAFFKLSFSPPEFDCILLGVGEDGHTASLFPRTDALKEKNHWVTANYVEKFSSNRITMTLPVLNNARKVIFLLSGSSKSGILKQLFIADGAEVHYPAQMVRPTKGEVIWLFDKDAAAQLPAEIRFKAFHI